MACAHSPKLHVNPPNSSKVAGESEKYHRAARDFRREVFAMSIATKSNANSVELFAITLEPLAIVMEFLPFGELFEHAHAEQPLNVVSKAKIALDLAVGLSGLHDAELLHNDFKSPNVLLVQDPNKVDFTRPLAKISDLGLAQPGKGTTRLSFTA